MLLSRYEVIRRLGSGGGGSVFEVADRLRDGARLALKALWPDVGSRGLVGALRAELGVMASVKHPRLCRVFDFGRLPADADLPGAPEDGRGGYFLTRELVDGVELGQTPAVLEGVLAEVCLLLADAARGLEVLHMAGMRHGDFKPANAILDPSGRVRLIDFGLTVAEGARRTAGTLAYMAPEILARRAVDRRADLYALGVSLYQLCAGTLPSGDRRRSELIDWHRAGARPRLDRVVSQAPAPLADLCDQLMAVDPDERLPTALEVTAALESCARSLGADVPERRGELVIPHIAMPQLGALERAFDARRDGRGGSAVYELVGDTGSGRSTTLTELGWRLALQGVEVVHGADVAHGRPFGALGVALERLSAITGSQSPLQSLTRASDTSSIQSFAAIARWLETAAQHWPVAILLDDFDFADDASRALVDYLAFGLASHARVMIVATRIGEAASSEPSFVGRVPKVGMRPLRESDVSELVARVAGRRDEGLALRLVRHTGGNLLHLVHVLEELARCDFADVDTVSLPPGLAQSIEELFQGAAPPVRRLCEVLAVIGRAVDRALLGDVLDRVGEAGVIDALAGAVERGLCALDAASRVALCRPAVRQQLHASLDEADRSTLHLAAANALESSGLLQSRDPELVFHLVRGKDLASARDRVLEALAHLAGAGDHAAALELGVATLALVGSRKDRFTRALRLEVGELARARGDAARAAEALGPLIADRRASASDRDRARITLGRAFEEAGEIDQAESLWREVIERGDDASKRSASRELSRLFIKRGRSEEALAVVEQALAGVDEDDLHLGCSRAFAAGMCGKDDGAETALVEIASRAGEIDDETLRATALNYAAMLAFKRGDYRSAERSQRRALEAAIAGGDVIRIGGLRVNVASNAFHFGDYAGCLRELTAAVSILRAAGAHTVAVIARRNLGHLLVELGSYEQARVELARTISAATELDMRVHVAGAEALLGIAEFRGGDQAGGIARVEAALTQFERIGGERYIAETLLDLAELSLESGGAGHLESAGAHLSRADAIDATHSGVTRRARFLALSAWHQARAGAPEQSRNRLEQLDQATDEVRERGGRHLAWSVDAMAAEALELLGETELAVQRREAALELLRQMAAGLSEGHRAAFWHDPRRRRLRPAPTSASSGAAANGGAVPGIATTWLGSSEPSSDRLFRLLDIYRRMSSERDVERLLEMVMDTAVDLSGAERGFVLLANGSGAGLRTAVARNLPAAHLEAMERADSSAGSVSAEQIPYSRTVAERVFHSGELVLSNNPRQDPRFDQAQSVHALHLESVLCIPVHARGRVAGVLYLESRFERVSFNDADLKLLMAFGDQVAIMLENATLLDENIRRAAELERAHADIESLLAERTAMLAARTEELASARRDLASMRRRFLGDRGAYGLIGKSPAMERVFELIERLAATDVPVLVLGESGTGKELIARALHEYGARKDRPMVSVNCGALPETLLESELFGHERGAFTGADKTRRGLFETANGGTLFLDEVGDTPERMQATLLRVLQEGVIRRVGGTEDIAVDVRVVAATNRDLEQRVARGQFRRDLFYRLHVVPVHAPALRERPEDVPLLAEHFLEVAAERTGLAPKAFSRRAIQHLMAHHWPGNVRQLEHAVTNALVMADGDQIEVEDFVLDGVRASPVSDPDARKRRERDRVIAALEQANWNKSKAARLLEMPRRTFYRRLAEFGIQ